MDPTEIKLPARAFEEIFAQSKVNGGEYRGEELPQIKWRWPKGTYLQRRLAALRMNRAYGVEER